MPLSDEPTDAMGTWVGVAGTEAGVAVGTGRGVADAGAGGGGVAEGVGGGGVTVGDGRDGVRKRAVEVAVGGGRDGVAVACGANGVEPTPPLEHACTRGIRAPRDWRRVVEVTLLWRRAVFFH